MDTKLHNALAAVYTSFMVVGQLGKEPEAGKVAVFHSAGRRMPTQDLVSHLATTFKCSPSCHVLALLYVDRAVQTGEVVLNKLTLHRLLAIATVLAVKFLDDLFYSNAYYARVSGLTLPDLNNLEVKLLSLLGWRTFPIESEFSRYVRLVQNQFDEI